MTEDRHRAKRWGVWASPELLRDFTGAASRTGRPASAVMRDLMRWFARHPGAELPERPPEQEDPA